MGRNLHESSVVRPDQRIARCGLKVWVDEDQLNIGDSRRSGIDRALHGPEQSENTGHVTDAPTTPTLFVCFSKFQWTN